HNAALAIAVAATVLNNDTMAVPAAVYGFLMNIPAGVTTVMFARSRTEQASAEPGAESLTADRSA
ncbi:hypothetical protein GV791_31025, partial [Nocardia cyriacigeorgica]|nr:hypothetical protein [Nocardia cyriacigeorgica]